jgi:ABC-type transporter Mla subunit MlaD
MMVIPVDSNLTEVLTHSMKAVREEILRVLDNIQRPVAELTDELADQLFGYLRVLYHRNERLAEAALAYPFAQGATDKISVNYLNGFLDPVATAQIELFPEREGERQLDLFFALDEHEELCQAA